MFSLKLTCMSQPDPEKGECVGVRGLHKIITLSQYSVFLVLCLYFQSIQKLTLDRKQSTALRCLFFWCLFFHVLSCFSGNILKWLATKNIWDVIYTERMVWAIPSEHCAQKSAVFSLSCRETETHIFIFCLGKTYLKVLLLYFWEGELCCLLRSVLEGFK